MRRIIIARSAHEILSLRHAWERLESQPSATMFQSFAWNYFAARVFAEREAPHVIYSADDDGEALIPAAVDVTHSRTALIGEGLFDYRDVLFGGDPHALTSAWNRLSQLRLPFSAGALRAGSKFAAWENFNVSRFYGAPQVRLQEVSAAEFAAKHNRLRRSRRRLERQGTSLKCHTGHNSELVRFVYRKKALQPSANSNNLFRDPLRQQFMVEVAQAMGNACEVFTLESKTTLIAALVTFRDRRVRRCYTIYFDQAWAKYSPGMVLLYEVTCQSLEAGLDCDYMTGEQDYKMRFATSVLPLYWAQASAETMANTSPTNILARVAS